MTDKILEKFRQLLVREDGIIESVYNFQACDKFKEIFDQCPGHKSFLIDIDINNKIILCVTDNSDGVRIKIGDKYLYIKKGPVYNEDILRNDIYPIFIQLLYLGVIFPSNKDILSYWEKPEDDLNGAECYAAEDQLVKSKYLGDIIEKYCKNVASAFEIGCNIGRNINYLKTKMGLSVGAIEISKYAIEQMKIKYDALADADIYIGNAPEVIKKVPNQAYDIVYSMAVLMHIHPDVKEDFWENIVRISNKYLITIENELRSSERNWHRNYEQIFTELGLKSIYSETLGHEQLLFGYQVRIFEK
ncbi:MAG: class I SAM-dependent methyltransferase [Proteobacteria bacterium]|nr:class I SAM-dependent methyltransferase [Pseudomonadota bacterium]MBU1388899.1 class I SAM-dependent methyltransferase [Pseudomonadota bacterium]MBU1543451.1 class I SAM-dependent methyltransferase [Pseudomonadota bacterium]MBU2480778.1 class I SAM-dependent methyltransferase [Pseudomonadota bacterium]